MHYTISAFSPSSPSLSSTYSCFSPTCTSSEHFYIVRWFLLHALYFINIFFDTFLIYLFLFLYILGWAEWWFSSPPLLHECLRCYLCSSIKYEYIQKALRTFEIHTIILFNIMCWLLDFRSYPKFTHHRNIFLSFSLSFSFSILFCPYFLVSPKYSLTPLQCIIIIWVVVCIVEIIFFLLLFYSRLQIVLLLVLRRHFLLLSLLPCSLIFNFFPFFHFFFSPCMYWDLIYEIISSISLSTSCSYFSWSSNSKIFKFLLPWIILNV